MAYLVGTDEAGYGPNLGPLVIAASVWEVPDELLSSDLYDILDGVISHKSQPSDELTRLAIADSKQLYSPGGGLGQLERGVLSALLITKQLGKLPCDWREVCCSLAPDCDSEMDAVPWYRNEVDSVPMNASSESLVALQTSWSDELQRHDIRLRRIQAVACQPQRFNSAVEQEGSKGSVLSGLTLRLVRDLIDPLGDAAIFVHCDKHGGRNKYNHLLQEFFPDYLVEVRCEGRARSAYCWGPAERRVEASFVAKGESFLPSALASMAAKYLRELAMRSFNQFWLEQIPNLKPTAGYPVDAKRFKQQIQDIQQKLGISDLALWRQR